MKNIEILADFIEQLCTPEEAFDLVEDLKQILPNLERSHFNAGIN